MRDRVTSLACLQIFLLLGIICAFFFMIHVSHAAVINVPDSYPTIQQAVEAAADGDTINVSRRSGEEQSVYYEKFVIDKQLVLVGESRETIIIDGNGTGSVIRVQADNVEIRGFTIRNAGRKYSGIRANGYSYLTVANNTIETSKYGVALLDSYYNTVTENVLFKNSAAGISIYESIGNNVSYNNASESAYGINLSSTNTTFVVGNTAADNSYGIYLEYSSNDTVSSNTLLRNGVDGIFPHACHDVTVTNNQVSESAYGIQLYDSNTVTLLGNKATDNSYGIYLAYSGPSNNIENNTISINDWGINLYNSSGNTLTGNTISQNTYGVQPTQNSNNNLIYHNNLINNTEQAVWNPYCTNTWDNGYPSGGNHWSDYTGTDSNGDGIGDTAYTIDPMNRDRYPLMTPWGFSHDVAVINVAVSTTKAYEGDTVNITVTAENQGTYSETFDVTASYENTTLAILGTVGTQQVTDLAAGQEITLTFSWNTAEVQPCVNYTIKAEASTVPNESDTEDNTFTDGTVKVKVLGDVNGDGSVDVSDLTIVSIAYGSFEGEPDYNPDADLNKDGIVDMKDLATVARNLGRTC
jgi:parallel beta-helix repeat protein